MIHLMHHIIKSLAVFVVINAASSFAWDDNDDFSGGGFKTKSSQNNYGFKSHQSEDTSFVSQQRNSLKVDSLQQAQEKQNRCNEEFSAQSRKMNEEQNKSWQKLRDKRDAEDDEWEAQQWRDVETVAGAFVASGPYYKTGQRMVLTDKGLVYSTGSGSVIGPDGYYFRNGNDWVGPNGKLADQSGSGENTYIWSSDGDSAIGSGRGYFTERGYSWPAYPEQVSRPVVLRSTR